MSEVHRIADPATVERARSGDRTALASLWRIYQPQLLRLLRAKRSPNPEDVASQVWIDVGRALARFEGDGVDFRKWLFTIASRRSTDEVRRIGRRSEDPIDEVEHRAVAADDDAATDLDDALELIATLPPNMAEAVMLRLISDLSFAEVAEVMRSSEGNARVLVHRGLTKLRAEIARRSGASAHTGRHLEAAGPSGVQIAASEVRGENS